MRGPLALDWSRHAAMSNRVEEMPARYPIEDADSLAVSGDFAARRGALIATHGIVDRFTTLIRFAGVPCFRTRKHALEYQSMAPLVVSYPAHSW